MTFRQQRSTALALMPVGRVARGCDSPGPPDQAVAQTIDRRVVVGPAQVTRLLAAVRGLSGRGEHLEAFYACLYYAYLRPSEAVMLKQADCRLPGHGWGRIDLAASAARAGKDWTDDGTARQARGLKHRAQHETRSIPIPPVLVQLLRSHLKRYGTAPDGRLFRTVRGGLIQDSAYSAVWQEARAAALTPAQHASPLARRPYDLRHAGVSLALNAGVPRHGSRPPRRAQRRRPAEDLRPLHRRAVRRRQQAHRRRPRQRRHQ
jgi:hypothetical protein